MTTPTIDCHAHIYPADLSFAADAWMTPDHAAPIEDYLSELARHGIARAVLAGASILGDDNSYALAACEANPNLRTTLIVRPDISRGALKAMAARGAVGVRLQLMHRPLPDLTDADHRRLFGHIDALGWHLHVHDDAARLANVLPILAETGVPLVVDHYGRPDLDARTEGEGFRNLLKTLENGRTWVKFAAGYRLKDPALLADAAARLLAVAGPERIFWGSDWPFSGFEGKVAYADALADFDRVVPEGEARALIGGANAARFYFGEG